MNYRALHLNGEQSSVTQRTALYHTRKHDGSNTKTLFINAIGGQEKTSNLALAQILLEFCKEEEEICRCMDSAATADLVKVSRVVERWMEVEKKKPANPTPSRTKAKSASSSSSSSNTTGSSQSMDVEDVEAVGESGSANKMIQDEELPQNGRMSDDEVAAGGDMDEIDYDEFVAFDLNYRDDSDDDVEEKEAWEPNGFDEEDDFDADDEFDEEEQEAHGPSKRVRYEQPSSASQSQSSSSASASSSGIQTRSRSKSSSQSQVMMMEE